MEKGRTRRKTEEELPYEVRQFLEIVERIVLRMVAPGETTPDGSGNAHQATDKERAQANE